MMSWLMLYKFDIHEYINLMDDKLFEYHHGYLPILVIIYYHLNFINDS